MTADLGARVRTHETTRRAGIRGPLGIAAIVFGGLLFLAGVGWGGFWLLAALIDPPPPDVFVVVVAVALAGPVLGILAAALLSVGGFALRRGATDISYRLEEYDNGVVLEVGDRRAEVPWSEVEFFRPPSKTPLFGVGIEVPYLFFAVGDGTLRVEVRGLPDLRDWGDSIEDRVFDARFPLARKALEDGENIRFGSVFVTPKGISGFGLLNDTIAWDRLKGLGVGKHNFLVVREKGVPVAQKGPLFIEVPNPRVLFALANEHAKG